MGLNLFAVRINQFIVRQIQLKRDFNSLKCCYTIILIACTLALSFHAFSSFKIWRVLIGQPITNSDQDGFSWMVWLVLYADTVLKLASMGLKLISIQASVFMCLFKRVNFKGSLYPNHFIFEINIGKGRIRHTTTLKLNDEFLDRLKID